MNSHQDRHISGWLGYRHAFLLGSLLLVITIRPFLSERIIGLALVDVFLGLTLLGGALACARSKFQLMLTGVVCAIAVVTQIAWEVEQATPMLHAYLASYFVFYFLVALSVSRSLFRKDLRISTDSLCGALSVYLLFGLMWTMLYVLLELSAPGSFHITDVELGFEHRFDRLLGFSFTTLTTLGYGNVSPATPQADSLATLEAIAGQVYLAVVVARLVALQITQNTNGSEGRSSS